MDKFFSIFGKLALVFIILGVLFGLGYYFGTGTLPFPTSPAPGAVTTTAISAPTEAEPTQRVSPTAAPQTKTVNAGVTSGLSFTLYTVEVPDTWTVAKEHEDEPSPMDTLTLTRGQYKIKIFQAATGGAMCLYTGDPDFEGPSSRYDTFVVITTKDGTALRRSGTTETSGATRGFTVCQKGSDGSYGAPTTYGHIGYTTPLTADPSILTEMDAIIASLSKS